MKRMLGLPELATILPLNENDFASINQGLPAYAIICHGADVPIFADVFGLCRRSYIAAWGDLRWGIGAAPHWALPAMGWGRL